MTLQIGWLSTGRDEAAIKLLRYVHDGITSGDIDAEIAYVFSNRENGEDLNSDRFFAAVRGLGIELRQLSSQNYKAEMKKVAKDKWRRKYHSEVMNMLGNNTDIELMAGYMLILPPEMCQSKNCINLHPDLPGRYAGTWEEVIHQVIRNRATEAGAMIHLATNELDRGPPITFCKFPLRGGSWNEHWEGGGDELFSKIRNAGVARELPLIYQTVKAFADGRVGIKDKQVYAGDKTVEGGYDVSAEVEEVVRKESSGVLT